MRIFLLGTGYVGKALLKELKGIEVWASTTTPEKVEELETMADRVFLMSATDPKLTEILDQCDGIIITVAPKQGASYRDTYLETAKAVTDALEGRTKPFYLLYTSSTSVYGDHHGEWVDETSERRATSDNQKILCETEDLYLKANAKTCILRLSGIYGPGRELEARAKRMSGKELPGTGDEPTNNIHLDDIVKGILDCAKNQREGIYNLANEEHPTKKELYDTLCAKLNIPPPIWIGGNAGYGSNCRVIPFSR